MATDVDYNEYFRKMIFQEIARHRFYTKWWNDRSKETGQNFMLKLQSSRFEMAEKTMIDFAKRALHIDDNGIEEGIRFCCTTSSDESHPV